MAARKMTFSIPEEIAHEFVRRVPSGARSKYLVASLKRALFERDADLARACLAANRDRGLKAQESDWGALKDPIEGDWK